LLVQSAEEVRGLVEKAQVEVLTPMGSFSA
jgi:hypothetical protein